MANREQHIPQFDSDRPLEEPARDEFDRASFAAGVARCIHALPHGQCFVIGIHGPWGDGKTTALHFVDDALARRGDAHRVWFNPWRYVGEDAMLAGFFRTLAAKADVRLRTAFEGLASFTAKAARIASIGIHGADTVAELAKEHAAATMEETHERLVAGLKDAETRLVVFVDDIDRLDVHEVETLFRVIKACADLPNVVYVLAFDRDQVASALGARVAGGGMEGGRRFLEKIIQIPLSLPPATPEAMERVCKRRVRELLDRVGVVLDDEAAREWERGFARGVAVRLRTPRNIQQYVNALNFAVPMLKGEVYMSDLLLVEGLRVFYPSAYETVRQRLADFIGHIPRYRLLALRRQQEADLLAAEKGALDEREGNTLEALVQQMFPYYHAPGIASGMFFNRDGQFDRDRRICSPRYAERYFLYAVGSDDVAEKDVEAIIGEANGSDGSRLRELVAAQAGVLKQSALVATLARRAGDFKGNGAARMAETLAALSERFPEPVSVREDGHAGVDAARLAGRLVAGMASGDARAHGAERVLNVTESMWFATAFMRLVDPRHPDPRAKGAVLEGEGLKSVRRLYANHVKAFLDSGENPFDTVRRWKFDVLFSWALAAGREVVHERFVPRMQQDGTITLRMLRALTAPVPELDEENLDTLNLIVDVDRLYAVVQPQWIDTTRQRGPDHWPDMTPDDRTFAEFWHAYTAWTTKRQKR